MAEEEEEKVVAFLDKLKTLDFTIYNYQKDVILNSNVVRGGLFDRSEAIKLSESRIGTNNGRAPFKGLDVGDAKNLSHCDLDKITNNFSDCIGQVGRALLFRGFMDDGQEVTVKIWKFMFPAVYSCVDYPHNFHDEIVLLERSKLKSCPFLVKMIGFCFEKKLAVVYDLKFKRSLWDSFGCEEFGWKERMKVATNFALLLKTLTVEKLDLSWSSVDIMIDEEYNIKLVNFIINDPTSGTCDGASVSDDIVMEKQYIFGFGMLLLELIMKRGCHWEHMSQLGSYIRDRKGGSAVNETLEVDAGTGIEITKLIGSCVYGTFSTARY